MKTHENHQNHCAGYIGEMTAQLAKMARDDGLDLLAHLLEMAMLEAETVGKNAYHAKHS